MQKVTILFAVLSVLAVTVHNCDGYKILGIFPTFGKSHYILGAAIMKKLAEEGHEVTVISPFTEKQKLPNYKEIMIDGIIEKFEEMNINLLDFPDQSIWQSTFMLYGMGEFICNHTLTHPNIQKLLKSDAKFDLIFMEVFVTDSLIGFGSHFDAPVIGLGTFGSNVWINNMVGSPSELAIWPHHSLDFSDRMTFFQRVLNVAANVYDTLLLNYFHYPLQKKLYDAHFPDPKPDFYHAVKHGVALTFLNTHFSIAYPKSYAPNMIEVGGMQINRKSKPLPADIQAYLDSAKDGAVFFSLGSNVKAKLLPAHTRDAILKSFAKFPKIKFLWKWEDPELPGKPDNLFVQDWFPQDDLLGHPNLRLFITHGGLLSTTETIYHGVPIIGIPLFADQYLNMQRAANAGFAVMLKFKALNEESLTAALTEALSTNKYKERAIEMSKRYRDQPMEPLDLITYWVEYIARHKGAPFMQSAAQDLNFWQYHMLDVVAFFIAVLVVVFLVIRKAFRAICCGGKKKASPKKKRN